MIVPDITAGDWVDRVIAGGAKAYVRERDLPHLIPLFERELADTSVAGRRRIIAKLARACRSERRRARHWSYALNRHLALLSAYHAEVAGLEHEAARLTKRRTA